jgi:SAM-dependent methyltransferase
MSKKIAKRLMALNLRFYTIFAPSFAASRSVSDPALSCILPYIPERVRVLDVGCGHGRLALLLDQKRPGSTYLGIDFVPEIIKLARVRTKSLLNISADFFVVDITRPDWSKKFSKTNFDCLVALAVFHHLPGFNLRARVLRQSAGLLAPGGKLILSTWQFLDSPRMQKKIINWKEAGIDEGKLEPGDYLLSWKRGGVGRRYCHLVDKTELTRLAKKAGLFIRKTWRAGGREGNLSLYAVLEKI